MSRDRLNHYRTLYVQPDAPPEVIKAAWRALMSARRVHPDLGGDHDEAVRLNIAYEVLGHPASRAAYDRRGQAGAPSGGVSSSQAPARESPGAPACPFCRRPHAGSLQRDSRCLGCNSPLMPLPGSAARGTPLDDDLGRRRDPRFARDAAVQIWLPGDAKPRAARLQDLSFSGLQLHTDEALPAGQVVRVIAPWFEALFTVMRCRALRTGQHALHGKLLTLLLQQQARGVYVDSRA
jgi:curved DNA-binding protein CbpA